MAFVLMAKDMIIKEESQPSLWQHSRGAYWTTSLYPHLGAGLVNKILWFLAVSGRLGVISATR